jgi:hypothetical protein
MAALSAIRSATDFECTAASCRPEWLMRPIPLLLASATLAACTSMPQAMDSILRPWVGAPYADIVYKWGEPDRRTGKADGSTVAEWSTAERLLIAGSSPTRDAATSQATNTAAPYVPARTVNAVCVRQVSVSPAGTITDASWSGNACCVAAISGDCRSWLREASR